MAQRTDTFDLGRLGLSSGEARRFQLEVAIDPVELGGERYAVDCAGVRLDVSRTSTGYSLRLRSEMRLEGPCMRCLGEADRSVSLDAREVDQPGADDDELRSPYLDGDELDVRAWARDSLVLAVPAQVVCREDCLGLCATCGADLNAAGPDHSHEAASDPRWSKLAELRFE